MELRNNETIFQVVKGDLWANWGIFAEQKRGKYTFTNQRVFFTPTKLMGIGSDIEFTFNDVARIDKCSIGPFLPFGVKVLTKQGKKYKLSLQKRDSWISYIKDRM